ncbi:chorismate mutase [Treponema sp. R6D11]
MNLEEARKSIDIIDKRILELYNMRIEFSEFIAQYKMQNDIPLLQQEREAEILTAKPAHEKELLEYIIDASTRIQIKERLKGKSIALIGPMGSGKSTVASILSQLSISIFLDFKYCLHMLPRTTNGAVSLPEKCPPAILSL